jgi:hypothetical protein
LCSQSVQHLNLPFWTGRVLGSHLLHHLHMTVLDSHPTCPSIPWTGRILSSQPLQNLQMPALYCLPGNTIRTRHVELLPRPGNERNRRHVVTDSQFLHRRGCQLISPLPRHESELRVAGGAQELPNISQHDRKRPGGRRGRLHDALCAALANWQQTRRAARNEK